MLSHFLYTDDDFVERIKGCYVRVLLDVRTRSASQDPNDRYFIACVKGAIHGETYTGFCSDDTTTDWHITIHLPPCFDVTANADVLQLNSISNSLCRPSEYQQWLTIHQDHRTPLPKVVSLHYRLTVLESDKMEASEASPSTRQRQRCAVEESGANSSTLQRVMVEYMALPRPADLANLTVEDLEVIQRDALTELIRTRREMKRRLLCAVCQANEPTHVCYPCTHQVLCRHCAENIGSTQSPTCPVCRCPAIDLFEPFS